MTLRIGDREVRRLHCSGCAREYDHVTGFVYSGDGAYAVYYAAAHGHPEHEAWLDVVLGTWGGDDDRDHVTFSCRVGAEGASAVDATVACEGKAPLFGRKLTREEALAHPRLAAFWEVVDLVVVEDPAVAAELAR